MGAGCYYTHKCNKEKAAWVVVPDFGNDQEAFDDWFFFLKDEIGNLGYEEINKRHFQNGLFDLYLDSTYYGEGVILRLEPRANEWEKEYNLAMANHSRSETKLLKTLIKLNYSLRIATSGYTSTILIL